MHSKPFRRLKHKTQVFIAPYGDHYRTRLTHTLEVAQVARTIGRALRLNEDLIEAIALGHDVGHTPFGHAGEEMLDRAVRNQLGGPSHFKHYEQSVRVLDVLTPLNLSKEVLDGIDGHSKGSADLTDADGEAKSTLEAAVVRISDRIAYLNSDLDDAFRAGFSGKLPFFIEELGPSHGKRLTAMVGDVVENSLGQPSINMSAYMQETLNQMKDWMFENVYLAYAERNPDTLKAKGVIASLFAHYLNSDLPAGYAGVQGVVDYISGMTDRFAITEYERLFCTA